MRFGKTIQQRITVEGAESLTITQRHDNKDAGLYDIRVLPRKVDKLDNESKAIAAFMFELLGMYENGQAQDFSFNAIYNPRTRRIDRVELVTRVRQDD